MSVSQLAELLARAQIKKQIPSIALRSSTLSPLRSCALSLTWSPLEQSLLELALAIDNPVDRLFDPAQFFFTLERLLCVPLLHYCQVLA